MTYEVKARWTVGILGWLIANTTGRFTYSRRKDDYLIWYFEEHADAVLFRLKFGATG